MLGLVHVVQAVGASEHPLEVRFFTTVFGMICSNIFFAHRYFNNPTAKFQEVMRELAVGLMVQVDLFALQAGLLHQIGSVRPR